MAPLHRIGMNEEDLCWLKLKWRGQLSISNKISKLQPTATPTITKYLFPFLFSLFLSTSFPFCYLTPPSSPLYSFSAHVSPHPLQISQSHKPHYPFQFSSFGSPKTWFFPLAVRFFDKFDDENSLWISYI